MNATASQTGRRRGSRIWSILASSLLNLAAVLGFVCILAVVASFVFNISLIMFSTGSMSPAIPTGSVAVVREIPAAEVQAGDIVTVERPGKPPVTHRVVQVDPEQGDFRLLTLRGDANEQNDQEPYLVSKVRIVLFSVPGLASVITTLGNPLVLGAITLAATALVLWAFWPRTARRGGSTAGVLVVLVLGSSGAVLGDSPAHAATEEHQIRGEVITLVSIGDTAQMQNLQPGVPVSWQVGVLSDPPEPGRIDVSLAADGELAEEPGTLVVTVAGCSQRWTDEICPGTQSQLLEPQAASGLASNDHLLVRGAAGQSVWLLVTAWIESSTASNAGGTAELRVTASGFGDSVEIVPEHPLANTGLDLPLPAMLLAALLGIAGGAVLLGVTRGRVRR